MHAGPAQGHGGAAFSTHICTTFRWMMVSSSLYKIVELHECMNVFFVIYKHYIHIICTCVGASYRLLFPSVLSFLEALFVGRELHHINIIYVCGSAANIFKVRLWAINNCLDLFINKYFGLVTQLRLGSSFP